MQRSCETAYIGSTSALHIDAASVQTGTAGGSVSRPTFPLSMSKVTRLLAKERDASVAAVIFRLMSQMIKVGHLSFQSRLNTTDMT